MKLRCFTRPASLVAGLILLVSSSRGQTPGALDPAFNPGTGPTNEIRSLAVQPDGKILIGGRFTEFNGASRIGIARVNADGSVDPSFNPGAGVSGEIEGIGVYAIGVQADGKIVIGGVFGTVNGAPHVNMARLNADGSVDAGFNANTSQDVLQGVRALAIQADGKVVFGGTFDTVNGTPRANIARVNTDGSLDTGFDPGTVGGDTQRFVAAVGIQPDGKIVFAGKMESNNVLRLNPNGSPDPGFDLSASPDSNVYALAIQADGKIIVGGTFREYGESFRFYIARANADGTLDLSYKPDLGLGNFSVFAIALQSDGKAIIAGQGDDKTPPGIARINPDATLDTTYTAGIRPDNEEIDALVINPLNNDAVVGGRYFQINGVDRNSIAELLSGPLGTANGPHPPFFNGETALSNGVFYLSFSDDNYFGYYSYLPDSHYIYHFDMGYEYVFDGMDANRGVYLYDFKSNGFFYTSPGFPFPYLYDFSLNTTLYYFPDPDNFGHYNTDGVRYFVRLDTGEIFSK